MPRAYVPASWAMAVMQGWNPRAAVVLRTTHGLSDRVLCILGFMEQGSMAQDHTLPWHTRIHKAVGQKLYELIDG